ncbi:retrovirus-related pol polyprotein from transposon TNT 1-94 [Tanacetum coccineum]
MNPKDECVKYQYTGSLVGIHWLVDVDDWTGWNVDIKDGASVKYLGVLHLHMDLFGPVTPRSINHEKYTLVIVDAYSRKNRTLIEAARTMLSGSVFLKQYWTEAIATACYTQNRSTFVKRHLKTPYEAFRKRIPNIDFLHVFGCPVFIHNHKDHLGNFDEKADDGYLLDTHLFPKPSESSTQEDNKLKKTYHIKFDESLDASKFTKASVDNINIAESERYPPDEYLHPYEPSQWYQTNSNEVSFVEPYESPEPVVLETESKHSNHINDEQIIDNIPSTKDIQIFEHLSSPKVEDTSVHDTIPIPNPSLSIPSMTSPAPQDRWSQDKHIKLVNVIGDLGAGMLTRAMARELSDASAHDVSLNKVWTLVPAPYGKTIIGLKWVFMNKRDETGIVIKNKARLVAQGYNQQEGIDYDETFVPVTILEAIKIFLAFATYMNFIVYQMYVKSAFLNGKLKEEVYVKQPLGFESSEFPNHIKQSERRISINQEKYVKDLLKKYDINGSSLKTPMVPPNNLGPDLNGKAVNETQYRGMIGSLMYLTASRLDIYFLTCACERYQENHKESHLIVVKRIFSAKKHQSMAMYSAEAKYVATAGCCANILWMKSQLTDYDIIYEKIWLLLAGPLKNTGRFPSAMEPAELGYNAGNSLQERNFQTPL